ncbi:MAG: DEAD/DEAH box helicase [Spirochaetales bacterium]|nr:DEAD/DEAH box helicase [Spirochaetales bacterium]
MLNSFSRPETDQQILKLIQTAGFRQPTPLQKAVIPLSIQQKDLIVESNGCQGKTVAIVTSAILKTTISKNGLQTLVLADSQPDIIKLYSTARRISIKKTRLPGISCIGQNRNTGSELRQLNRGPSLIIGSSERLIDHIRRGNINLEEVKNIFIYYPENPDSGFDKDILFIYSKLPKRHSTTLYCTHQPKDPELLKLLKKPHVFTPDDIREIRTEADLYSVQKEKTKVEMLVKIILANHVSKGIILTGNKAVLHRLRLFLSKNGRFSIIPAFGKKFGGVIPDMGFLVTDNPEQLHGNPDAGYIFLLDIHRYRNVYSSIMQPASGRSRITIIYSPNEAGYITDLEEKYKVKMNKKQEAKGTDLISEKLKSMVKKIRTEEDPELMDWYKKIIKKNVPIHLRSYIGAYLLKENSGGIAPAPPSKRMKPEKAAKQDGEFDTLFISIGKNRRVFPRDLSGMICNTLEMSNDNIGPIKVLDNYSFVDISHAYAQKAIDSLDGSDFRGRKITVNFARKKG